MIAASLGLARRRSGRFVQQNTGRQSGEGRELCSTNGLGRRGREASLCRIFFHELRRLLRRRRRLDDCLPPRCRATPGRLGGSRSAGREAHFNCCCRLTLSSSSAPTLPRSPLGSPDRRCPPSWCRRTSMGAVKRRGRHQRAIRSNHPVLVRLRVRVSAASVRRPHRTTHNSSPNLDGRQFPIRRSWRRPPRRRC